MSRTMLARQRAAIAALDARRLQSRHAARAAGAARHDRVRARGRRHRRAQGLHASSTTSLMNVFVYAGMSQLVAMEAWPERVTLGAMAALAVLMVTVNARMLLMSAALYPWLRSSPPWRIYPTLHVLTDPSWIIAMRYRAERRLRRRRPARVERAAGGGVDRGDVRRPCRRHADRRSAPLRHRSGDADLLCRHADPALARQRGRRSPGSSPAWWRSPCISSRAAGGSSSPVRSPAASSEASSMTPIESADFGVLAAIAAMAVATYAMRAGGFWMMQHVPPSAAAAQDAERAARLGDRRRRCCRSWCATASPRSWRSAPRWRRCC